MHVHVCMRLHGRRGLLAADPLGMHMCMCTCTCACACTVAAAFLRLIMEPSSAMWIGISHIGQKARASSSLPWHVSQMKMSRGSACSDARSRW